jgi:hypothetical protein
MGYKYDQGYERGQQDAQAKIEPRIADRTWFGQGYRDGYLNELKKGGR